MPAKPAAVALSALVVASVALASPMPAAAVPPQQVTQRYEIQATVDPSSGSVEAVVEAELTNESRWPMRHAHIAFIPRAQGFGALDGPVLVNDAPIEVEWVTSIVMRVPVDVPAGERVSVRIPFTLQVGLATPAFTARTSLANGVLSLGQWFPILSTVHEVHGIGDSTVTFSAERIRLSLTTTADLPRDAVACPGMVEAPETTGTEWVCDAADVRDLSVVVNPRFRLVTRDAGGVEVRVHAETVDGARTADLAAEALAGMEERFGAYPWTDLVLAEVGSAGGFSMEYPRQIHLTRDKVTDPYVIFHEVAHQWFYGLVGNDQQDEPWLDEAWADFSARLLMGIGENACGTSPVDSPVFAWPADPVTGGDWTSCAGYFHSVFYRGTEFLTAVRNAMGDDAFFAAMRAWLDEQRHAFATGRELLWHLQRSTDADLAPIYAAYLARPDPRPFASLGAVAGGTSAASGVMGALGTR